MTGLRWWSKNSDTFSIGIPQLEMTGLPDTFLRRLWILGNRYSFPELIVFLYSKEKYLKFKGKIRKHGIAFLTWSLYHFTKPDFMIHFPILKFFFASIKYSYLSQTTTQEPLSGFLITIILSPANDLIASHSNLISQLLFALWGF